MNKYKLDYKLTNGEKGTQNMPANTIEGAKKGALAHIADREMVEVDEIDESSLVVTYVGPWVRNKNVECEGCT
ncbi:hypothetical protein CHH91_04500 [Virgibacillus sp. 7505]|uniref:hypothetical protein n=1 Tax=Virgibacillus sp. 7505 TaxID=2022548 RepID=UPI000BA670A7|nr:hypothetical protein [Virgibacillus sp. 7505]PAE17272.1 hypothetical protein CHH91_04500 [Virgibacillus sp. 7505]